ncbi:dimethylarginine dimethylaminohydrolase family protein [Melghirimyces algeriensis]|uniref:N-Dimethylarginine dimethylaminohydrolase n=1 Tax=Melghirimyces algeriensis TaxID=910412 RepID=A0A521CIN8_9BACL|nr:dimethylarginine dimethylaminohydrolase family protein [Melghirimyces algeriensis]SMO59294.1 N-Dimethylarginine dimethylaminohydrolase [Melghirimyces algeriensis]
MAQATETETRHLPRCWNEYAPLKQVILCPPRFIEIREVINRTQRHFAKENIDRERAEKQHRILVNTLRDFNVEVILLNPDSRFPEQVFTRDIGFTLGPRLIISRMDEPIRQGEESVLKTSLTKNGIPFTTISTGNIEGGDVIIDGDTVYIGDSGRTSINAIEEIRQNLPHMNIVSLSFPEKYLHLDCVFNPLSHREALIYPPAFSRSDLSRLASRYHLIEVSTEEQFQLGVNVLSIGNRRVLSQPINPMVNKKLRQHGFSVVEVDLSEIIKSGGAFRCCTLPLIRG